MRPPAATGTPYLILSRDDYVVLGPEDFGAPGLYATEIIGPYVRIQASGPLLTVHDSTIEPHKGIGHHPHRYNERLFYIMTGELDHDDRLNGITGHMATGDVGMFTEGRRGMVHSEWNNGDEPAHAFILVYATDPIPEQTAFGVLSGADAPEYDEAAGVRTKELVGGQSPLRVNGDIRLFTDSLVAPGAALDFRTDSGEGGLVSVQQGEARINGDVLATGDTLVCPPSAEPRKLRLEAAGEARLLRVVHGPGFGFRLS